MSDTSRNNTSRSSAGGMDIDDNDSSQEDLSHPAQFEQSSFDTNTAPQMFLPADENANPTAHWNLQPPQTQPTIIDQDMHDTEAQGDQNITLQQTTPDSILATLNGRIIGHIILQHNIDIAGILNSLSTDSVLYVPTMLVLRSNQPQVTENDSSDFQSLLGTANSNELPGSTSSENPPKKKSRTVDPKAEPVPPKPASHYAQAAEEPVGMTKNADDSCLTCLKNNRKCKGTNIIMVKDRKRCESCARPGKETAGRVCYWKLPSRGVYTYEQAQDILSKEYGGRKQVNNTRADRVKRERPTASKDSSPMMDKEELGDDSGVEEFSHDGDFDINTSNEHDDGVSGSQGHVTGEHHSAINSAFNDLFGVIVQDLGLSDDYNSVSTRLVVEREIRDALTGSGAYEDLIEGVDRRIQREIFARVSDDIIFLERVLECEQAGEGK